MPLLCHWHKTPQYSVFYPFSNFLIFISWEVNKSGLSAVCRKGFLYLSLKKEWPFAIFDRPYSETFCTLSAALNDVIFSWVNRSLTRQKCHKLWQYLLISSLRLSSCEWCLKRRSKLTGFYDTRGAIQTATFTVNLRNNRIEWIMHLAQCSIIIWWDQMLILALGLLCVKIS